MQNQNKKPFRIVLTGGPGGGKTTAADLIRREIGEKIVVVPEAATMLFRGGFPRCKNSLARRAAQTAIYHVQINLEEVHRALYSGRVLLCDRGTVDSAIYWPEDDGDFFEMMHSSLENELKRYDAVIFFESAAVGNISIEGGNPVRTESLEEARELDKKLQEVWSQHKNYYFIPHQQSFIKKLELAIKVIKGLIHTNGY
ncbi:MAG: hypothetical protein D6797_08740 [Bdellovibrio sp.]|nr:MAG: hypothetical protein D6797_08740 [Bdellovibrio sp.]